MKIRFERKMDTKDKFDYTIVNGFHDMIWAMGIIIYLIKNNKFLINIF